MRSSLTSRTQHKSTSYYGSDSNSSMKNAFFFHTEVQLEATKASVNANGVL